MAAARNAGKLISSMSMSSRSQSILRLRRPRLWDNRKASYIETRHGLTFYGGRTMKIAGMARLSLLVVALAVSVPVSYAHDGERRHEHTDDSVAPSDSITDAFPDDIPAQTAGIGRQSAGPVICFGRICCLGPVCWIRACPPCPPCPAPVWITHTDHSHYPCQDHEHEYYWVSNQRSSDCKCFCNSRSNVHCLTYLED